MAVKQWTPASRVSVSVQAATQENIAKQVCWSRLLIASILRKRERDFAHTLAANIVTEN